MDEKLKFLNVGCGSKYHLDWVNIDMKSNSPSVISSNLLNGIPFPDESFDVVYHSQVLEHLPKEKAPFFLQECFRVLKKNGIIRVVTPDLENIVDEYRKYLSMNLINPSDESKANYDWILLELFDQTVRNFSGGQMMKYLQQENLVNEQYIIDRIGYIGRSIREQYKSGTKSEGSLNAFSLLGPIIKILRNVKRNIFNLFLSEKYKIGDFRLGGEIHMWMYDKYSLSRLLKDIGFTGIGVKSAFESDIKNWDLFELDLKDGIPYDPTSLFMEARK